MIYSSLAVLAMSASAIVNPFSNLVHMHPRPAHPDTRITVTIYNKAAGFRDLKIDGQIYTVLSNQELLIKAPKGTLVYTNSTMLTHHRGDLILQITPELNNQSVILD